MVWQLLYSAVRVQLSFIKFKLNVSCFLFDSCLATLLLLLLLIFCQLEGLDAHRPLCNQALTQLPQAGGAAVILGLDGRQAAEAVVEVHAAQPLQLRSYRAVHCGGRPLLLWTDRETERDQRTNHDKMASACRRRQNTENSSTHTQTLGRVLSREKKIKKDRERTKQQPHFLCPL